MASLSLRQFLEYIRAFNAKDYQKQHSFYHPDVRLVLPDPEVGTLVGSEGIMNHYAVLHATAEETVVPILVMVDQGRIFFVMETYFRYCQATDRAVHGYNAQAGDVIKVTVWALYDMDGGKMKHITCNGLHHEFLGTADVNLPINESWSRADSTVKRCWGSASLL
ncbi:nuclear transport factor 2 family protein [Aspergillus brunneoviolaceus CBS 621.78]|uniref:Uncharacterized protein n=1 Tax=Aspergillus brunneoviolaceus CBS 621.78 TaxID=1450534 RepID=A0ACD1GCB2_9EURO|nr:hypothetical protein BO95DRAFT_430930 [Aspergillus brunneoviolaceus CBS 621.78]RAH46896.1 hypothetical protein BO95DRAFT_430930 [Aspergillus brunneoviolaceus CBS 621.78]